MNGYDLSKAWFDFAFENPEKINPAHAAIYFFAIEHCNRLGWKQKFGFPTQMVMDAVGIRKHDTYIKYFNDLVEWRFFELIEKSRNQYSSNIIRLRSAFPKNGKALGKALRQHDGRHGESTGESSGESKGSIIKPDNAEPLNLKPQLENFGDFQESKKPRRQFQFDPNLEDGSGPMRWAHFGHYMTDGCPDEPFPDSDDDDIFEKNKWHWAIGMMCKYGRNLGTEGQCRHLARQMKHEKYQIQHAAKVIMNYRAFGRMEVLTHDEFKTYSTGPTGIDI